MAEVGIGMPPVSQAVRASSLHTAAGQVVPDLDVPPMSHLLVQLLLWQPYRNGI